eukprot:PhM_4_TR8201/c0_g1_i1/m.2749
MGSSHSKSRLQSSRAAQSTTVASAPKFQEVSMTRAMSHYAISTIASPLSPPTWDEPPSPSLCFDNPTPPPVDCQTPPTNSLYAGVEGGDGSALYHWLDGVEPEQVPVVHDTPSLLEQTMLDASAVEDEVLWPTVVPPRMKQLRIADVTSLTATIGYMLCDDILEENDRVLSLATKSMSLSASNSTPSAMDSYGALGRSNSGRMSTSGGGAQHFSHPNACVSLSRRRRPRRLPTRGRLPRRLPTRGRLPRRLPTPSSRPTRAPHASAASL